MDARTMTSHEQQVLAPRTTTAVITSNTPMSSTVNHITLQLDEQRQFLAGQFGWLTIKQGEQELRRPYSIASAPWEQELSLCIKQAPKGSVSTTVCSLATGAHVDLFFPLGMFTLPLQPDEKSSYVFIAAGTGIAPIRSMIRTLFEHAYNETGKDTDKEVVLLFGARETTGLLYQEEFKTLANKKENFTYRATLSQEEQPPFGVMKGRVTDHVQELIPLTQDVKYYVCGLNKMVEEVKEELIKRGAHEQSIHAEKYG